VACLRVGDALASAGFSPQVSLGLLHAVPEVMYSEIKYSEVKLSEIEFSKIKESEIKESAKTF